MTIKRIAINEYITLNLGITADEGGKIYNDIVSIISNGDNVILDFEGVERTTTAFLNVVLGDLYKDYTSDELKQRIIFENVNPATAARIKRVTDNAKLFYQQQEIFNQLIDESLNENH